jgi:hypothetical protein
MQIILFNRANAAGIEAIGTIHFQIREQDVAQNSTDYFAILAHIFGLAARNTPNLYYLPQ